MYLEYTIHSNKKKCIPRIIMQRLLIDIKHFFQPFQQKFYKEKFEEWVSEWVSE
jgi:hypothetical protein